MEGRCAEPSTDAWELCIKSVISSPGHIPRFLYILLGFGHCKEIMTIGAWRQLGVTGKKWPAYTNQPLYFNSKVSKQA
jgi:hypothetical protein